MVWCHPTGQGNRLADRFLMQEKESSRTELEIMTIRLPGLTPDSRHKIRAVTW